MQKISPDQNWVHHDNKNQGQILKHDGICSPSPVFSVGHIYLAFSRFSSFDTIAVAVMEGHRQLTQNEKLITSHIFMKCFKVSTLYLNLCRLHILLSVCSNYSHR